MQNLSRAAALVVVLMVLVTCGSVASPPRLAESPASPTVTMPLPSIQTPSPLVNTPVLASTSPPATAQPSVEPSAAVAGAADSGLELLDPVRITIIYDNTVYDDAAASGDLAAEWGFAAWIEYGDHTILFDTGPAGGVLLGNMDQLGLEPEEIDIVVVSHLHADHTGGLSALLDTGIRPIVYAPVAFPESFTGGVRARTELIEVLEPVEILPGLYSTGQLGGGPAEQALVFETSEGMVIITGCAHPGILRILRQAQDLVDGEIALVIGGFHLVDTDSMEVDTIVDTFLQVGVKQVCPTHCTGEKAVRRFASAFGENYLAGGVGRVFIMGDEPPSAEGPTPAVQQKTVSYWPTSGWKVSSPEEQGMDSHLLADMLAQIQEQGHAIDSVQVVRNGYLVVDAYNHPFGPDRLHVIRSCTKSIVSALIGIAIEQGALQGVEQPIAELFPDRTIANLDESKQAMTLEDLLTMATGLECRDSYLYRWQGLQRMQQSDDWVQFILDLPMAEEPGDRFEYCNGASFLLSAIIQEATGMSTKAFADEQLFRPLGIEDVDWPSNPDGISIGWGSMRMEPRDMAKIGYLYLNGGRWEDRQLLTTEWIEASTEKHIAATLQDGYGYQWWVSDLGYYMALGYGGQFIFVVPNANLVAVITSELAERDFYVPQQLLNRFIIPAARSVEPLPANPRGVEELEIRTEALAQP